MRPIYRPVDLKDDQTYQLVTAKRSRGGIVARERLLGRNIKVKDQYEVHTGDFILSNRQISHGGVGLVPNELHGSIVSGEYTVLEPCGPIHLPYLSALSHSIYFQQISFHSSIGVHVEKLVFRLNDWLKWEIALPPIHEQERIVECLSVWDIAIRRTETILDAERQRARLMLRRLIGASTLATVRLNDIVDAFAGGTPSRSNADFFDGDIPWVKSGEVVGGRITSTEEHISKAALESSAARMVPAGSTLVAMYGATAGAIAALDIDAATNQAVLALVPNDARLSGEFLRLALRSRVPALMRKVQGSGQPNLSRDIVLEESIPLPPLQEQLRISTIMTLLERGIALREAALERLSAQRRQFAQELLNGMRRLPITGKSSEAAA
ncbi:MAG: restriction endonuclease subunit S [Hyphomonadaceae bacterium]|nr:restriction endonuclease subunit S [Hyphomonadaceae bacterium]